MKQCLSILSFLIPILHKYDSVMAQIDSSVIPPPFLPDLSNTTTMVVSENVQGALDANEATVNIVPRPPITNSLYVSTSLFKKIKCISALKSTNKQFITLCGIVAVLIRVSWLLIMHLLAVDALVELRVMVVGDIFVILATSNRIHLLVTMTFLN